MSEVKHRYKSTTDDNVIEFVKRITHRAKIDSKGKASMNKLEDDILEFKYVESRTKKGSTMQILESVFKQYLKMRNFVKC